MEFSLKDAVRQIKALKDRVLKIEADVRTLKDALGSRTSWNTEVPEWLGSTICADMTNGTYFGVLKWFDRYNISLVEKGRTVILNKAQMISIRKG